MTISFQTCDLTTITRHKCHPPASILGLRGDEKQVIDLEWPNREGGRVSCYGTVLQHFTGFMTFGVIYTCLRSHSLLCVGMLASLYGIYNTTTVSTAGMLCTGTNCFGGEYHYKGHERGEVL